MERKSPVRDYRPPGSFRRAPGNRCPYLDKNGYLTRENVDGEGDAVKLAAKNGRRAASRQERISTGANWENRKGRTLSKTRNCMDCAVTRMRMAIDRNLRQKQTQRTARGDPSGTNLRRAYDTTLGLRMRRMRTRQFSSADAFIN